MASALCPVASVVSVAPRCSVESSSSSSSISSGGVCGSNSITSSSFGSSSVKLPLVAQQQAFPGSNMPISVEMTVADPSLQYANLMWFRGSYNAQVFVGEDEPADSVVRRFRKAVMMAGVIPECRRRRFFETPQDIVKRKQQNARRKKPRRFTGPRPEGFGGFGDKKEGGSNANNDDDDFWGYAEEGADANL